MVSDLVIGVSPAQKFITYLLDSRFNNLFSENLAGKVGANELADGVERSEITKQITDRHKVRPHIPARFIATHESTLRRAGHLDPLALSPTPEASSKNVCLPGDDAE